MGDQPDHFTVVLYLNTSGKALVLESNAGDVLTEWVVSGFTAKATAAGAYLVFVKVVGEEARAIMRKACITGGIFSDEAHMLIHSPERLLTVCVREAVDGRRLTFDEAYAEVNHG